MTMRRATPDSVKPLTRRQRAVLTIITQYYAAAGEGCSVRYIARRLRIHHSTVQEHIDALYRKGWIMMPSAPRPRFGDARE